MRISDWSSDVCSSDLKVTNGDAGSALMREPKLAAALIEACVKAVEVPVTVKMRMGWDHDSLNAPELAHIAEDLGAKLVTVHGRTRNQKIGRASCRERVCQYV